MKLKIVGFILIVLQVFSMMGVFLGAESLGGHVFSWYLGRFIFGIVGAILLIVAYKRENE